MSKFLEDKPQNFAFSAVEKEGPKFGFRGRGDDKF
jgi:hypothetical protein